ncbi:MAG: cysteine desulfurase NifS [Verrucomicrobia bacterium]|nr:cysteine desulfurase NifS [Verrucomicrobiota bacterium]
MDRVIYVDNNATTTVAPEVLDAMVPFFCERYGNASSMHAFGGTVRHDLDAAREKVAMLLGATPGEIVFTSCGTESDNTAVIGTLRANPDRRHVLTTRVEHPAIRSLCQYLAKAHYEITEVPVNRQGELDVEFLADSIRPDTALVSVMWANNETGVIFPIEQVAEIAHAAGAVFHTDAVQAVGKLPINLAESRIDLLSLSGHKFHAPKGIGALYVRRGTKLTPLLIGGHQEHGRRGGTENSASIVGLGTAAELAAERIDDENTRVKAMRDRLEQRILESTPDCFVNGARDERLPNTTNISFEYVEGEAILLRLDELGICASSGSACTSGSLEPSHVMRAMGVPFTAAHGSIRFSLSVYNTGEEIDFIAEHIPRIIQDLRAISPYGARGEESRRT